QEILSRTSLDVTLFAVASWARMAASWVPMLLTLLWHAVSSCLLVGGCSCGDTLKWLKEHTALQVISLSHVLVGVGWCWPEYLQLK
ncbi:hypothetical protein V8C86DRAFT_2706376, partial [Haematococcus lacustris]